jgi:mRNA-degrading endonuclease toxin of MazEF toxin-antitoxin module
VNWIQATETLDLLESVTVCPITSVDLGAHYVRVAITTGRRSSMDRDSWIMADKVVTVPRSALITRHARTPHRRMYQ